MSDRFPNDWDEVAALPAERFTTPPVQEILDRASSWGLPEPYSLIVRSRDTKTYKTIERSYRSLGAAGRFIEQELNRGKEVVYYDDETLYSPGVRKPGKRR